MEREYTQELTELSKGWGYTLLHSLKQNYEVGVASRVRAIPSSHLVTYIVQLQDPNDLDKVLKLEEQMALRMGAKSCRISRFYGDVQFEVPLPQSMWQTLYAKDIGRKDGLWLSVGKTSRLAPVHFKLNSPCIAPVLVTGRTGSGKTELMKLLLWELCIQNDPNNLQLVIQDPKGKFIAWNSSAHLALPILRTNEEVVLGLNWLAHQLVARMEIPEPQPRLVFAIDELLMLMAIDDKGVSKTLGKLASVGREKNIHMLVATQRPDRKHFDSLGAANIGLRMVGQAADTTEATVAAGFGGTGAHLLDGRGDMLAIQNGQTYRMQSAMIRDRELGKLERGNVPKLPIITNTVDISDNLEWTPKEMAVGLTDVGILKLREELHIGQPKATRLRGYATETIRELNTIGYNVTEK